MQVAKPTQNCSRIIFDQIITYSIVAILFKGKVKGLINFCINAVHVQCVQISTMQLISYDFGDECMYVTVREKSEEYTVS